MRKGFTLIELLVVVLIIGILASVGLTQYYKTVEQARQSEVIEFTRAYIDAQNRYWMKTGFYSWDLASLDIDRPTKGPANTIWEGGVLTYFGVISSGRTVLTFRRRQSVPLYGAYEIRMTFVQSIPYRLDKAYCVPANSNNTFDPCTKVINQTFDSDLYKSMKRNNIW